MLETAYNFLLTNPLESYTALVATLGIAFWALDRRSMKAALRATRGLEISSLRLERQKAEASVERNFVALQLKCRSFRDAWRDHDWRNGPTLGSPLHTTQEQKEILQVELQAQSYLDEFKASAPELDSFEVEELESYFTAANRTSLEFARLASQLPEPRNRFH